MSSQPTLPGFDGHTFSEELGAGTSPCNSPDGQSIAPSGLAPAPASPSPRRAKGKARRTIATSGPSSSGSSPSATLQSCLANKLRQMMDVNGSPEYVLTWKDWDMPSGPPICALRARARHISGSDCSGWPLDGYGTPTDHERTFTPRQVAHGCQLANQVALVGYPTTRGADADKGIRTEAGSIVEFARKGQGSDLPTIVSLAGYSTPTAQDHSRGSLPPRSTDTGVPLSQMVALAGYPRPNVPLGGRSVSAGRMTSTGATPDGKKRQVDLSFVAALAGYVTPGAFDAENGNTPETWAARQARNPNTGGRTAAKDLAVQVQLVGYATPRKSDDKAPPAPDSTHTTRGHVRADTLPLPATAVCPPGETSLSSLTATANCGGRALNPAMSRWLMGFPQNGETPGWDTCSPGWSSWDTVQRLLAEYSQRQEAAA